MMIEPALRHVSGKQLEYLSAMARCGTGPVSSGDVAREMGVDSASVGTYRRRLVDAALIEAPVYGVVSFAIPYMREYLLEHVGNKMPSEAVFKKALFMGNRVLVQIACQ